MTQFRPTPRRRASAPALALAVAALTVTATSLLSGADTAEALRNWPQWRGPLATGAAPEADPPVEWSETKNVKWKTAIPGAGSSTPAVWNDRIFVMTAIRLGKDGQPKPAEEQGASPAAGPFRGGPPPGGFGGPGGPPPGGPGGFPPGGPGGPGGPPPGGPGGRGPRGGMGPSEKPTDTYQFVVLCLERATGKELWRQVAREEVPHEGIQPNNTYASSSPATDGEVVVAFFGSHGLHCYDLEGHLKWTKQLGRMQTRNAFGEGASPALHVNTVAVDWDDETDNDFVAAFDKRDGRELWRTPRNEPTGWSTPLVVEHDGRTEVVVNATGKVRSYDLATGKELWSCAGQTANAIPSPVADAGSVYVTSGFRGAALYAIQLGATGDVTGAPAIRWTRNKGTPYVPSPLLAGDALYYVSGNNGILTCVNAKTGEPYYEQERLSALREVYASPVAAKDRVYLLGRDGKCLVLKQGAKAEILATNTLDDKTDASMALAGGELYIRGARSLYCIARN